MKVKKLVFLSILVAQALVLYIIEGVLPVPFIVPGAKLGLSNIITVVTLYIFGFKETFIVLFVRILMSSMFGGSISALIYSISGGFLSLISMHILMKLLKSKISTVGVSITGGVFHNIGQVVAAVIIIENVNIIVYFPALLVGGAFTGFFVGLTAEYLIKHIGKLKLHLE